MTKPTNTLKRQGTFQKCRRNGDEPQPEINIPDAPGFLNDDALGEWMRMSAELHKLNLLSDMDMAALASYCMAWGDVANLSRQIKEIEKDSPVVEGSRGGQIINPLYRERRYAMDTMLKYIKEFGLSPSSRTKISTGKTGGENEFKQFFIKKA